MTFAFAPISPADAQALLNARYAPGHFEAETFAVAYLPCESELPDWSDDEWDGVFVMATHENIALTCPAALRGVAYTRARQPEQLTLW